MNLKIRRQDFRMFSLDAILQMVIIGFLTGSYYALISLGLTLILGVLRIINIAHGEFLMIAMYLSYFFVIWLKIDPYVSIFLVAPIMFALGSFIYFIAIRPILDDLPINQILLTIGLSIFLQNLALFLFSPDFRTIETPYSASNILLGSIVVGIPHLISFIVAAFISFACYWFLRNTDIGRQVRAAAQQKHAAMLVGIDVKKIYLITFGLGSALLGVAGPIIVPIYYTSPNIGASFLVIAFVVVVLGGMGNFLGALIGGIIVGIAESLGTLIMPGSMSSVITFSIFLLLLLFKPQGLFGGRKI